MGVIGGAVLLSGGAAGPALGALVLTTVPAGPGAAALMTTGPVGLLIIGAESDEQVNSVTYDCWKAVLHDESPEPSPGKLLRDVVMDSRVKHISLDCAKEIAPGVPSITLVNAWDEQFEISSLTVPWTGQLLLHATKVI